MLYSRTIVYYISDTCSNGTTADYQVHDVRNCVFARKKTRQQKKSPANQREKREDQNKRILARLVACIRVCV